MVQAVFLFRRLTEFRTVAPAELEAVLLGHPGKSVHYSVHLFAYFCLFDLDIVDAAVIGVEGERTELPRLNSIKFYSWVEFADRVLSRAYIVPRVKPANQEEVKAFITNVHKWLEGRVSKHKYLRGGIVLIEAVPKRYILPNTESNRV